MFGFKTIVLLFSIIAVSLAQKTLTHNVFDYELYESFIDTEQCQLDLRRRSTFPFYDASFRVPSGLMRGNLYHLGNYPQCLNIKQSFEEDGDVVGKFCMINVPLNESIITIEWPDWSSTWSSERIEQFRSMRTAMAAEVGRISRDEDETISVEMSLAVCIPRSCSVNQALSPYFNFTFIRLNYEEQFCRLLNDKPFSVADYVAVVLFSVIGFLTILSTSYDLYQTFVLKRNPKEVSKYLTCASVYTNTTRLFTFSNVPGALNCLDGIRALSILWVIMGHTILAYFIYYMSNGLDTMEWLQSKQSLWAKSANISVDTFFFLSGLLLVYTNAKKSKPMTLLKNLHLFYLHRLLRMFPLLGAAVLLQASVFHHVADGVNWHLVAEQVQNCRQYWWSALLYVQNLVNPIEICLPHTWYLSVDMQLHILAPLILFWVLGSRRTAWTALAISILAVHAGSTTYCFIKNFVPSHWSNIDNLDLVQEYVLYYYNNTLTRAPVFIVGMLFGYILHVTRESKVKMSWLFVIISYIVSLLLMTHCIFFLDYVSQPDWDNQTINNLLNSFMRTTWGVSLGWIIFACVKGYGGPINWFLSWHMWKFIARISYAMYIFHYPYQFMRAGTYIRPAHFDIGDIWIIHASDVLMTIIISIAACVIIDAPFSTLQKLLLGGGSKPKPNKPTDADKNEASTANKETGINNVTLTKDNGHLTTIQEHNNKQL